ncbi:MAG: ribonuclease HII [Clostridiales bacterium]|nr:ribonuclease HII [Clostridiales bacterium]
MINWYEYENQAHSEGYKVVCGVDEAGRGPLAGPVCAACVIMPENSKLEGVINDSKKLSEKKREELYDLICDEAIAYSISMVDEKVIDEINILQATFKAMKNAIDNISVKPDIALIDGNRMPPELSVEGRTVIKGDAKSISIAAASILAKVTRDRFLYQLDKEYPEYQFAKHKGYGTKLHYEMLEKYGISPVHRRSFLKKLSDLPDLKR